MKLIFPIILQARIPAATPIAEAAEALAAIARQNHCFAEADFNGCKLMAGPHEDEADLVAIYQRHQADTKPKSSTWSPARYPGDAVRVQRFLRKVRGRVGEDFGDIRIQCYGDGAIRVATFLPGRLVQHEGDTPKTEPDRDEWARTSDQADAIFETFCQQALAEKWRYA